MEYITIAPHPFLSIKISRKRNKIPTSQYVKYLMHTQNVNKIVSYAIKYALTQLYGDLIYFSAVLVLQNINTSLYGELMMLQ